MFASYGKEAGTLTPKSKAAPETEEISATTALAEMAFRFPLRKYQQDIIDLIKLKFDRGERQLHIVAPPGAGKTIIGLQLISTFQVPSLILSPNTTIQSQWGEKVDLFLPPDVAPFKADELIGTHENKPLRPITLLTYQVLSTPGRELEYLTKLAHRSWVEELTKSRSITIGEAELRILELLQNNPKAHQQEISRHISRLRRRLTEVLELKEVLHENALSLLQALKRQNFQVVIFDECHHLTDYWAAIMTHLVNYLGNPIIIGLTGTPPENKSMSQENRYLSLVGEIDYQVPTPALVREGGLAPFQDLVYFSEPTEKELAFLEQQHDEFHSLIEELTASEAEGSGGATSSSIVTGGIVTGATASSDTVASVTASGATSPSDVSASGTSASGATAPSATAAAPTPSKLTAWIQQRLQEASEEPALKVVERKVAESSADYIIPQIKKNAQGTAVIRPTKADIKAQAKNTAKQAGRLRSQEETAHPPTREEAPPAAGRRRELSGWKLFADSRPALATALLRYCWNTHLPFPRHADVNESIRQAPLLEDWMVILEDYASHALKLSADKTDHKTFDRIKSAARKLGYGITEQGLRKQASPVDRVLAFSNSKAEAVVRILTIEYKNLQDRLRAAVVTDFERMSATAVKSLDGVLSEESGGAVAALKILLQSSVGEMVNPTLVTGSLLLVDRRICPQFVNAAKEYLHQHGHNFDLIVKEDEGQLFSELSAASSSWESRLYVGMATAIFERGITKCLIGTRGLFGEGWDSQALNTLIDLTTSTSPVSVKQLRGRSIRIQTDDPLGGKKVANNWDVVCIAAQLEKGLNDYQRFVRKHDGYFGIADDGQIECGVGHVHAALSELAPVEVFASLDKFNTEMTDRALIREYIYDLWKVGQPYKNQSLGCVELSALRPLALTPPHIKKDSNFKEHAKSLQGNLNAIWYEYSFFAVGGALVSALIFAHASLIVPLVPLLTFLFLGHRKYQTLFERLKAEICRPNTQDSSLMDIGTCVLSALQRRRLLPKAITREQIKVTKRRESAYRLYLEDVSPEQSSAFIQSIKEVLAPVSNQPYLIPKYEYFMAEGDDEKQHQQREERFFKSYLRGQAQPRITAYHPVPSLLARSEKGREAFESAWNKYVSPGFIVETETKPELIDKYYGIGPSLAQRVLWE